MAKIKPKNKAELQAIINQAIAEHGNKADLNFIDTSIITDMSELFFSEREHDGHFPANKYKDFNGNISKWNTSKVTNMSGMFAYAYAFNQPIDNWDTSQVTDMCWMFECAYAFNQPIGNWDTSQVTDMEGMFSIAYAFNQPINNWDTSQVTDIGDMFEGATLMNANPSNKPKFKYLSKEKEKMKTININVWDTDSVSDKRLRVALEFVHGIFPMDIRQSHLERVVANFRKGKADHLPLKPKSPEHYREWWHKVKKALLEREEKGELK